MVDESSIIVINPLLPLCSSNPNNLNRDEVPKITVSTNLECIKKDLKKKSFWVQIIEVIQFIFQIQNKDLFLIILIFNTLLNVHKKTITATNEILHRCIHLKITT